MLSLFCEKHYYLRDNPVEISLVAHNDDGGVRALRTHHQVPAIEFSLGTIGLINMSKPRMSTLKSEPIIPITRSLAQNSHFGTYWAHQHVHAQNVPIIHIARGGCFSQKI